MVRLGVNSRLRPSTVELIATDMDGTFLNAQHEASPRNIRAFRQAIEEGYVMAAATGRSRTGTLSSLKGNESEMGFSKGYPGVYLNGLSVFGPSGELLFQRTLDTDIVKDIANFCFTKLGLIEHVTFYSSDNIYCLRVTSHTYFSTLTYGEPTPIVLKRLDGKTTSINDLQLLDKLQICKVIITYHGEGLHEIRRHLEAEFGAHITIVSSAPHFVEMLPIGESKGRGLSRLLQYLNISHDRVLALGDAENDLEMLKACGQSYAMENAVSSAKKVAKRVGGHHDADGFAVVLEEALGIITSSYHCQSNRTLDKQRTGIPRRQ